MRGEGGRVSAWTTVGRCPKPDAQGLARHAAARATRHVLRRIALLGATAVLVATALPSHALPQPQDDRRTSSQPRRPDDRRAQMEQLRDALKAAPSEEAAGMIESRLRRMELEASTPAVTLLMGRGLREMSAGSFEEAVDVFTDALTLDPNLAEAYHQRAIAKFRSGDLFGAMQDIEETLRREPRSFSALRTLVDIAAAREDWKSAYEACEKMLEVDPKTPGGEDQLKELKRRAFGQEA